MTINLYLKVFNKNGFELLSEVYLNDLSENIVDHLLELNWQDKDDLPLNTEVFGILDWYGVEALDDNNENLDITSDQYITIVERMSE